ncbi:hypothetical protein AnigIFM63309_009990 [Aspergillus niger]|nr:hypothetical protein AnigIFM49718_006070 [Aspergillus niger]GLA35099.1 hypothetical protein AnigIFM63309_009990 [Aspergillus niger]
MTFAGSSVGRTKGYLDFLEKEQDYHTMVLYRSYDGLASSNFSSFPQEVSFEDIRGKETEFSIQEQGFCLYSLSTKMSYIDFDDDFEIRATLYPEVKRILQRLTGASIVEINFHWVRGKHPSGSGPVGYAHIDTTGPSGAYMFETYRANSGVDIAPSRRYEFYTFWVPLLPVQDYPLALCDQRTVKPEHLLPVTHYDSSATSQNCFLQHDPEQRWCFINNQQPSEAWIFYQGGNRIENKPGVPHGSFRSWDMGFDRRQSIEIKTMVIF